MKRFLIPILTLSLIAGGLHVGANAFAFGLGNSDLIETLATKLGKNTAEVQTAFDQIQKDRQTERQAEFASSLNTAVNEGKITAAQKQLILDKHQELQVKAAERQQAALTERAALKTWAETNGIDVQFLFMTGLKGGMHGMRGQMFPDF